MSYPAHYTPYLPWPERMPGTTTAAVVLLWVMLGIGACSSIALTAYIAWGETMVNGSLPTRYFTGTLVIAAVQILMCGLRGVFAIQIKRRSDQARIGAIVLEVVGLVFSVVSSIVMSAIVAPTTQTTTADAGAQTTWTGLDPTSVLWDISCNLPSILVVVFLCLPEARRWCDR